MFARHLYCKRNAFSRAVPAPTLDFDIHSDSNWKSLGRIGTWLGIGSVPAKRSPRLLLCLRGTSRGAASNSRNMCRMVEESTTQDVVKSLNLVPPGMTADLLQYHALRFAGLANSKDRVLWNSAKPISGLGWVGTLNVCFGSADLFHEKKSGKWIS